MKQRPFALFAFYLSDDACEYENRVRVRGGEESTKCGHKLNLNISWHLSKHETKPGHGGRY